MITVVTDNHFSRKGDGGLIVSVYVCVGGSKKGNKSSLQSNHNSATEFKRRICKSHRVITSQIIGVKLWWETQQQFFFSKPHEKDSFIRMLSAADQESLFESRQEKRVQLKM